MVAPIIAAAIPKVVDIFGDLFQSAFPNSAEREQKRLEYSLKVQETLNQLDLAQIEVNKIEAASASLFVAGWRPAIGWVCAGAFAWQLILKDVLTYAMAIAQINVPPLPAADSELLGWAMGGMLGLGSLRSYEKVKGVASIGLSTSLPWKKKTIQ